MGEGEITQSSNDATFKSLGKFRNALTAASTGRADLQFIAPTQCHNGFDAPATGANHSAYGIRFRTATQGVSGIFCVGTNMYLPVFVDQGGADPVTRIAGTV